MASTSGESPCHPVRALAMRSTNLRLPFFIRIFVNATWAVGQSVSLCCPLSRAHHLAPASCSYHNQSNGNSAEATKLLMMSRSKHTGTSTPLSLTNYPSSTLVLTRWKASSLCAIELKSSGCWQPTPPTCYRSQKTTGSQSRSKWTLLSEWRELHAGMDSWSKPTKDFLVVASSQLAKRMPKKQPSGPM